MSKKRALIMVDAEQWDRVQKLLSSNGYPVGSMSSYLRNCVTRLEEYLDLDEDHIPIPPGDPLAELEVSKVGLSAAAEIFGWQLDDWWDKSKDEDA